MKFIVSTIWFLSFLLSSVLFISLVAALLHYMWNGENDKVTLHLLAELTIFWSVSAIVTYGLGMWRNGFAYRKKIDRSPFSYNKRDAAQPNVPFNI